MVRSALVVTLLALMVVANVDRDDPGSASRPPASAPSDPEVPGEPGRANSASRVLFWVNVREVVALSDADLRMWQERGLDGFVAQTQWLADLGSDQRFTSDPAADLQGSDYRIQRELRDSRIVSRANALGMKLYLGFYAANKENLATPFADWFDDGEWSQKVLPRIAEFAGAARMLGFAGLALDQELYPQIGGATTASWAVAYPGNTRTPAETRRAVTARGRQVMTTVLQAFPAVEFQVYGSMFPGGWEEFARRQSVPDTDFGRIAHVEFWDGMTSVDGYGAVRFADAFLYKGTQLSGASWDAVNQYNLNGINAMFSNRLSNWAYASSRVFVSPFIWIDAGKSNYERARSPREVAEQLDAFRTWGTGGELLNYAQGFPTFDYGPYVDSLREASTPAVVDSEPPSISVTTVTRSGSKVDISGTAADNLALAAVRASPEGGQGTVAARMTWKVTGGSYRSSWEGSTDWTLTGLDVADGAEAVSVTAVDIKGLTTTVEVPIGT